MDIRGKIMKNWCPRILGAWQQTFYFTPMSCDSWNIFPPNLQATCLPLAGQEPPNDSIQGFVHLLRICLSEAFSDHLIADFMGKLWKTTCRISQTFQELHVAKPVIQ
jgi:hypothetical protein